MDPLSDYRQRLSDEVHACYDIAKRAREKGFDVTRKVEIPLASDMAERVQELIQIEGIAEKIRSVSQMFSREEVSISVARHVAASFMSEGKITALDKAVRVGLAILTEGILVAPLEGIASVDVRNNGDGTDYAALVFSGPIRGAGGTAQAMSVLIADIVRRDLGIGPFVAGEDEIQRYIEEIDSYNRIKHLQYLPSADEIRLVVSKSPVMIDGDGTEDEEVAGHRDMLRISTNKIRGGMCLVIGEGLIQKAKKILKHTENLALHEWDFLKDLLSKKSEGSQKSTNKSEKFLNDIIAGRPVFSHPGRPGGFRLRYGRSRVSGLAAASLHPATMEILGGFIAIGSQLKMELPGKAAAITPCDSIEPPMVLLANGDHRRIRDLKDARSVSDQVTAITDCGEILISYGDFAENNHKLEKPSYTEEYWRIQASRIPALEVYLSRQPDAREAIDISRKHGISLHPKYLHFWHDIGNDDMLSVRIAVRDNLSINPLSLPWEEGITQILIDLGVEFAVRDNRIYPAHPEILTAVLGLDREDPLPDSAISREASVIKNLESLSGMVIAEKSPTRIGARMGRPEKAGDRKMKPKVHILFPVESYGQNRRSIIIAGENSDGQYETDIAMRTCPKCGNSTPVPICETCGSPTVLSEGGARGRVDLQRLIERAEERTGISLSDLKEFKGVKKLMSHQKLCEPLEKGILRAYHDISINKDGTCRYDMSDIPLTHFRPGEIRVDEERIRKLGYSGKDEFEIFPQDIIIPRECATYLLDVSRFVDDLLTRYYKMEPYYNCRSPDDLIGQLVIGLAPHTSGGILGRIIGISEVSGCYAHPLFHAAKRRNCDGDEDSIMLLMDGLLNFSRGFLPSTRGGLMDAPLVLTLNLIPDEVDKEALNLDTLPRYPEEFYKAAMAEEMPSAIEEIMQPLKLHIATTGSATGLAYTHSSSDINEGITVSSYKTIGSMTEKIERQLSLAEKLRAVDENDVAARVLNSHFLPDIYGNFRKFFSQEFRCTKCNAKYRRIPISGRCRRCGSTTNLNLTIHRASIVKYLGETIMVSKRYRMPPYLISRIENLARTINGTFEEEREPSHDTLERFGADEL